MVRAASLMGLTEMIHLRPIPADAPYWTPFQYHIGERVVASIECDDMDLAGMDEPAWRGTIFSTNGLHTRIFKRFETFEEAVAWVEAKAADVNEGEKS